MTLPLVIEPAQLAQQLHDSSLLIIDLSSAENYQQGHIPGAIHVDPQRLLAGEGDIPNKLPNPMQLSTLFSEIGLTENRQVVVYDDQRGPWAGRMIWTLHCVGHQQCSFLNGQLEGWKNASLEIETQPNSPVPSYFEATIDDQLLADVRYISEHLDDPSVAIWDARSAEEYNGSKVVNARFGGHIPGAALYEWTDLLTEDNRLRPAAEVISELKAQGITPEKTVITHCQTHRRSGLTYLAAKHLGFEQVRCYDGSWFEWGNLDHTSKTTNH